MRPTPKWPIKSPQFLYETDFQAKGTLALRLFHFWPQDDEDTSSRRASPLVGLFQDSSDAKPRRRYQLAWHSAGDPSVAASIPRKGNASISTARAPLSATKLS